MDDCSEAPYLGGLCRAHHDEDVRRKRLSDQAFRALHFGEIDGAIPGDVALAQDLNQLRERWQVVCSVSISRHGTDIVPLKHANYAGDLCMSFAEHIVEAQWATDAGAAVAPSYENAKRWFWERIREIECGPDHK